jgi:hypothetical protein
MPHLIDENRLEILQRYPLKGHCWGRFALGSFPALELQNLLPDDLELAPQSYTPKDQHPLLFMFNNTWLYPNPYLINLVEDYNTKFNLNYFEFIAMLPYVQFKDNKEANAEGPYCFLPVLYLNNELAVWGGRVFWEFNKILTGFTVMANGNYTATDMNTGSVILSGESTLQGPRRPGNSYDNFIKILPILHLPVIEHGPYGYVSSIYQIHLVGVSITPADIGVVNLQSNFFPRGLFNIPSIAQNLLGAFHMNYKWKLSYIKFIRY